MILKSHKTAITTLNPGELKQHLHYPLTKCKVEPDISCIPWINQWCTDLPFLPWAIKHGRIVQMYDTTGDINMATRYLPTIVQRENTVLSIETFTRPTIS